MSTMLFNPPHPDLEAIRRMMFERLRTDLRWNSFNSLGNDYSGYVEFEGRSQEQLAFYVLQVFWQLVNEGILAPGNGGQSPNCLGFTLLNTAKQ